MMGRKETSRRKGNVAIYAKGKCITSSNLRNVAIYGECECFTTKAQLRQFTHINKDITKS